MNIEFNLTQIIFVVIAACGGVWTMGKSMASLYQIGVRRELQEQFRLKEVVDTARDQLFSTRLDGMDSTLKADAAQWQRVERELLNLKAEMPLHYVRREDYIRGQSVMEAKQDALYSRIELLQNQITVLINKGVSPHG